MVKIPSEIKPPIKGNITFDHVYILNGVNDTKVPLYLSVRANNSEDGNWNHLENITMKIGGQAEQRTVKIYITNDDFYSFFFETLFSNSTDFILFDHSQPMMYFCINI